MRAEKNLKSKQVDAVPEGFHTVTPFIVVDDAMGLMDFLRNAFDARITSLMKTDNGQVMHATVKIGDSQIMVTDAMEKYRAMSCMIYLYVENVDSTYKQALKANGVSLREPTNEFYGDRSAGVQDEWGNQWWIATHIEDVDDGEMERRKEKFMSKAER